MTEMKKRVLQDKEGNALAPVTLGECVYINGSDLPTYLGGIGGGSSSDGDVHKLALTGGAKFIIDFTNNTITHGTWMVYGDCTYFTTANFSQLTMNLGTSNATGSAGQLYYLIVQSSGMKLVQATNMTSDTGGLIVCGIDSTRVYPMLYPIQNIKVIGGTMFNHPFKSIRKMALLGDSITFGGCMDTFTAQINTVKLAVSGKTVMGTGGLVAQAESVTSDYDTAVIMGGTNDEGSLVSNGEFVSNKLGTLVATGSAFDKSTFYGAYQYIIETLLSKNKAMKILLVCPPRAFSSVTVERTGLKKVSEAVINVADFYGLPYTDLWHRCPINIITNATYLQDNLHPNSEGNDLIGKMVMGDFISYYCGGMF